MPCSLRVPQSIFLRVHVLLLAFILAACGSLPPGGSLEDGEPSTVVPAVFWGSHVFVPVHVSESDSLWMLLDTGSDMTIFGLAAAEELGMPVSGRSSAAGYGRDTLRGGVTEASIRIAGSSPYRLHRPVLDLSAMDPFVGRRLDGVLGGDFFLRFVVEIDYERRRVVLYDPALFRPRSGDVDIPLEVTEQRPYVQGLAVMPDGRELEGRFVIDTGSGSVISLNAPFVEEHNILAGLPGTVARKWSGTGGRGEDREGRLAGFQVGPFNLEAPIASLSVAETGLDASEDADGSIGAGVFRRFTVIIDYRGGALYLRPNQHLTAPFETDMAGFEVRTAGADFEEFAVDWIDADSPAEQADLKVGDVIVEVNGRPATDLIIPDWHALKRGEPGNILRLLVRRGGDTLSVPIRLARRV